MIFSRYNKKKIKKSQKTKMETSKKLAWFSGMCFAVTVLYSISIFTYGAIVGTMCDFTLPITLTTVTGAVFGTTAAFYYNKARFENIIKLQAGSLKSKYLILKDVKLLDEYRVQAELDNELSKIEYNFDNEKSITNQEITYNG